MRFITRNGNFIGLNKIDEIIEYRESKEGTNLDRSDMRI